MKNSFINNKNSGSAEESSRSVPFAVIEAYKTVRTNLIYALSQSEKRSFVVSSPSENEGKSTTAVNMAIAFSQLGSKVLLVDGDLRAPTIHRKMKLSNTVGLSSILAGFGVISESIHRVNDNLDVITSGPIPPNPSELISSQSMDEFLARVEQAYNYIIIDTPPVNVVTDAIALTSKTAGIVLVVKGNSTTHEQYKKAVAAVSFSNSKLLGVVMNGGEKSEYKYDSKYGD